MVTQPLKRQCSVHPKRAHSHQPKLELLARAPTDLSFASDTVDRVVVRQRHPGDPETGRDKSDVVGSMDDLNSMHERKTLIGGAIRTSRRLPDLATTQQRSMFSGFDTDTKALAVPDRYRL